MTEPDPPGPGSGGGPRWEAPDDGALDRALAELHAADRASAQLLGLLSFLADAPVPAWLLAERPDVLPGPLADRVRGGEEAVLTVGRSLAERGLAAVTERSLRIPESVSEGVRDRMAVREAGQFGSTAARLVFRAFPDRVGRPGAAGRSRALAPHVRAAAEHPAAGGRATAEAVHALARLGAFHREQGRPGRAEAVFRQALRVSGRGAPLEGPLRAVLADELASVLAGRDRREEAARMAARSVELARESLSPDAPQLPLLLSNAATTYREVGALERAARCYRAALDAAREAGSEAARPLVAELLAGLADVELARGRESASARAAERALGVADDVWGRTHPQTARASWILGDARRARGRHADASRLFRRALAIEEELRGAEHPAVGQKALALAGHLEEIGRTDEARAAYRRAADALRASLGDDADATRAALRHLERLDREA